MIRALLFIVTLCFTSLTQAGYIALSQDDYMARIQLSFQLEAGGTLTYTKQADGSSSNSPGVSRAIGYYTINDLGEAQADASLHKYGYDYNLFTETEQYGDMLIHPGTEILPEIVANENSTPLVDILAQVTLDWRFRVYGGPVTLQAVIHAENSLDTDTYLRVFDLSHHQLAFELVGGWMNEDEVILQPGIRYALHAQALEFNGDDDIETELDFGFGPDTPVVSANEPESLTLFVLSLLMLMGGPVARRVRG